MAIFRSLENITLAMLDFLRIVQPDLDTKPGSVARDLMVDVSAQELAQLYVELRNIANLQAVSTATSIDLDNLGRNFGIVRGSGSRATGAVVFTTNNIDSDIQIPLNSTVTARNGFTFRTQAQAAFLEANTSVYRANATRMRTDLDLAGIADEFAIEVAVEAVNPGLGGNVGKYSVVTQNLPGISNVTNLQALTGGSSTEDDNTYRSRILAVFAGSNTGTALGYVNALLVDPRIVDVLTIEPGDPLMTRDGTDVDINDAGEPVIISSGTGGKVDLVIQGSTLESFTESFIYRDQSGKSDPTDSSNDFVLGQRGISTLLDFQQRRRLTLQNGTLPFQPVDSVVSVSGSLSGPNFAEKFTDVDGQIKGSFELLKDTGAFGGSVFGFDKLHFISGNISLEDEAVTKGVYNGQDPLDFTDVQSISVVHQDVVISNESPTVSATDRTSLTLDHTPINSVERVVNITTGERYIVEEQNPDGEDGDQNLTGRIVISGSTLPTSTDILQVNYVWDAIYDENIDYDNLSFVSDFRTVQDSIDWGFSNRVIAEEQSVLYSLADGYHMIMAHPVSKVVNVNSRLSETVTNSSGVLVVSTSIENIVSVSDSAGREVFSTAAANGAFSGTEITLPTDTLLLNGEQATVVYNAEDLFSPLGVDNGTFDGNTIFLPNETVEPGDTVYVDYVANINTLLPATALTSLPATGSENEFVVDGSPTGAQPVSNIYDVEGEIERNLKFAPTYLQMEINGIPSRGRITINGTSFRKIEDVIVVLQDGLTIDLETSIENALDITIPSTGFVAYLAKVERVTVEEDLVSSVDHEFDILNYSIKTTQYSNGTAIADDSLTSTEIKLTATAENLDNNPTTGQRLRVTYYYSDTNQTENSLVLSAGVKISEFKYVYVNSISVASGFTGLSGNMSGTLTVSNFNQPISSSTYAASYSYVAPKDGERITVQYNLNRLIADATSRIEDVRPITADVLIKAAVELSVDLEMSVVATPTFRGTDANLEESVRETLTIFLTANGLNTTLDASDVINAAYTVSGVDRVTLTLFNVSGESGVVKTISADRDEFMVAGAITVNIESR